MAVDAFRAGNKGVQRILLEMVGGGGAAADGGGGLQDIGWCYGRCVGCLSVFLDKKEGKRKAEKCRKLNY